MFGNFNLNAGLSQLQDLGGRFQKIREDLEQNIESSLRTNVAPATGSSLDQDTSNVIASADGTVAFGDSWEGYSLGTTHDKAAFSEHTRSHNSRHDPESPTLSPSKAEFPQPQRSLIPGDPSAEGSGSEAAIHNEQRVQADLQTDDLQADGQEPTISMHSEHEQKQFPAPADQPDDSEQLDHPSETPSIRTFHQQQDHADSADSVDNTDRQSQSSDHSLPSALHPPNAVTPQHSSVQPLDSFGSLIETRPDSNGNAGPPSQESPTPELEAPSLAATPAEDQAEGARSLADLTSETPVDQQTQQQQQQQQQPVSSLYASRQVDQSSSNSLSESVEPVRGAQLHPDSASSSTEAQEHHQAAPGQLNGLVQESHESPVDEPGGPGSQQSIQDKQEQQAELPEMMREESEVEGMTKEAVWQMVQQLQAGLQAREKQLERQGQQLASMQEVQHQLQAECGRRLGAAERKVYALVKERDALRRGSDKLSSAHDLLKEKDSIIAQVMEEGERLSIKQGNMESTIKKLRSQIKELEASHTQAAAKLAVEEGKLEAVTKARQKAEAAAAAAQQQHKADLEQQKQHYEALLKQAHSWQVVAEEKAAASAKEGMGKRAREAEASAQALAETVEELRLTLDRQRASAELREEGLQREVRDLEQRCQAAEARHQDLAANIPEATRPLLRQLEAMQASASANAQAWAAAEASLTARLNDAESAAAAAAEREKRAWEKLQASNMRLAATAAAIDALKAELSEANAEVERAMQAQQAAAQQSSQAEQQAAQARQAEAAAHQRQLHLEHTLTHQLANEQAQNLEAATAAEERIQALERRLASQQDAALAHQAVAAGEPPAMAAPGYQWQLVRSSDRDSPRQGGAAGPRLRSSAASDKGSEDPYEQGSGHPTRLLSGAGEVEMLRTALRQKEDQITSLQSQLTNLEATRDSLAEEVIAAAGSEEAARAALAGMEASKEEHRQAQQQLLACTEMLGEKEERVEELRADLQDVKQLYKDQIEFMVEQLARLTQQQQPQPQLDEPQSLS
ncbi:hypothetical protein ABBQ32_000402 [Trebouxia sp. C0010 RCD-2024]